METNSSFMKKFNEVVEENLANPHLTNAELARLSGMSERQFYRKVEEETGMSPNLYLRESRLNRAAELLTGGEFTTVKEIALRVGFLKVSYFSKLYEKRMGVRPIEILRNPEA